MKQSEFWLSKMEKRHQNENRMANFISADRLLSAQILRPVLNQDLITSVANRLESFSAQLTAPERLALTALLDAAHEYSSHEKLAACSPEVVFDDAECKVVAGILDEPAPAKSNFDSSLVVILKATRLCNLRCSYCHFWSADPNSNMPFEVLARAIRDALQTPGIKTVDFVWHGGETTLLPLSLYRKAIWLQQHFRQPGQTITNSLQTNGTRLTPEWINFLRQYDFKLGVSLDGPPDLHDRRRVDAAGKPTSKRVQETIAELHANGLQFGVLMVVDEDVVKLGPERLLTYFLEIGVERVGLLNVIPANTPSEEFRGETYIPWRKFVDFLIELFRVWWPTYADRISFRELSDLIGKVQGSKPATCFFAGNCMGHYLTIEPSGDVFACDKFIGDESFHFGNLLRENLAAMSLSPSLATVRAETATAIDLTRKCHWFRVCQGGCPHDRYLRRRYNRFQDESCCGLAPLLSDISQALGNVITYNHA
jgi:uncharacterized protein